MSALSFDWVDAFTDKPFGGNGCAVVYGAEALSDDLCMSVVRETSLVECTFLSPSNVADIKVRYFLATREIPFAGHPTVATVASLVDRGVLPEGQIKLETNAGVIPVVARRNANGVIEVTMTQNTPVFGAQINAEIVAAVGGLRSEDIVVTPQVVSTGLPFVIAVVKDHTALRRVKMNSMALDVFRAQLTETDADVMEPFWVTLAGQTPSAQTFSRLVLAPPMPPEDPFTGSATGAMAAYLWHHGLIDHAEFLAEQGHWIGRPGQARVKVLGPRDAIVGVDVTGSAHVLMRGEMML